MRSYQCNRCTEIKNVYTVYTKIYFNIWAIDPVNAGKVYTAYTL